MDPVPVRQRPARRRRRRRTPREQQGFEGDVVDAVARLKQEEGPEIQVHGSSNLLQTLTAAGLVDEYSIWTFPVVVGAGKRLFGDATPPGALEMVDSEVSSTGVVMATYRPAGPIDPGSFAFEDPTPDEAERRRNLD